MNLFPILNNFIKYSSFDSEYDLIIGGRSATMKLLEKDVNAEFSCNEIARAPVIIGPKKILYNMVITWFIPIPATEPNKVQPEKDNISLCKASLRNG